MPRNSDSGKTGRAGLLSSAAQARSISGPNGERQHCLQNAWLRGEYGRRFSDEQFGLSQISESVDDVENGELSAIRAIASSGP